MHLGALADAGDPSFDRWAAGFFDLLDANNDGMIGPDEYRDFMGCLSIAPSDADTAFAQMDLNADGHISREEFAQLYRDYFTTEDPDDPASWFWGSSPAGAVPDPEVSLVRAKGVPSC